MKDVEAIDAIIKAHGNANRAATMMGESRQLLVFWRKKAEAGELPDSARVVLLREGHRLKLPGFDLAFALRKAA